MLRQSDSRGWGGKDLLGLFLSNAVDNHMPRASTEESYVQKEGNVCVVQKNETLPRVMKKLTQEGFFGMPVMDGRKYVGFITMLDLVKHVNNMFWGDDETSWIDYWAKSSDFADTTVDDILSVPDQWQGDPHPPLLASNSTLYALEVMTNHNLHRMVVLNEQTLRPTSILTQSMLISFLRQTTSRWGSFGDLRVSQMLPECGFPVITTLGTDTAINAFNLMEDNEIPALAIVDANGRLTGSLSMRDLRGVGDDGANFFRLFNTVNDFKRQARQDNPSLAPTSTHFEMARTPVSGLFVTPTQSIEDVIELMHDGNIHRCYVCTSRNNPVPTHVISQRDVLSFVKKHIIEVASAEGRGSSVSTKFMEEEKEEAGVAGNKRGRLQPSAAAFPNKRTSPRTRGIPIL